jgi:hypothetical protein
VIGRLEKSAIDWPDPRARAEFYCQVLGMRVNEEIGEWGSSAWSPVSGSWPFGGSLNRPRRAGLTLRILSNCTSTFVSDADQAEQGAHFAQKTVAITAHPPGQ